MKRKIFYTNYNDSFYNTKLKKLVKL